MIFPSNRVRIMVATKPVDFRKGHNGLAALVKNELRKDPASRACSSIEGSSLSVMLASPMWWNRWGLVPFLVLVLSKAHLGRHL